MPLHGARTSARLEIVQAVNRWKMARQLPVYRHYVYQPKLFSLRHIQQAVCVARRRRLVKSETLELAGFRGYKDAK